MIRNFWRTENKVFGIPDLAPAGRHGRIRRLPWFWHWTQAFTCALELMEEPELKRELHELLDELWSLRTFYYLKGAWVGAHSRGWPHDAPRDANVLHDYVQFGDFSLPEMPRTEYAGFLFHEAPEADRRQPWIEANRPKCARL